MKKTPVSLYHSAHSAAKVLLMLITACLLLPVYAAESAPSNAEVPGYKLSAIDFVSSPKMIAKDGKTAHGPTLFILNLPFPQTSKPVSVYVYMRSTGVKDQLIPTSMEARENGTAKRLDTAYPKTPGEWQWVKIKPLTFTKVGGRLRVDVRADKATGQPVDVESIVISTLDDLSDAALESTLPIFPIGPVARVTKTNVAPTIDGRFDDDAWKNAVTIEDFITYRAFLPATEPTKVLFIHDDKHLYILFQNTEPLLKTADMRGSELKTLAKSRDGDTVDGKMLHDVLSDDSCMIMLQPHLDGPVYEFTVNEKGVMADAKMQRNDLWGTRDLSWNSHFKAASRERDGFWTLEMAIPLADIGVSSLQSVNNWQVVILRNAAGRGKSSTWNLSGNGAHNPLEMGRLIFGEPQVSLIPDHPLETLKPGLNTIAAQVAAANPTKLRFVSRVQNGDDKADFYQDVIDASPQESKVQYQFDVSNSGKVAVRWGVLDAATMQPIYISPQINTSVQSRSLAMTLSTPDAYQLVVNDQVVAQGGKAESCEVQLSLRAGANVIALRADSGTATIATDAPWQKYFSDVWRANDASTPDATAAKLDDRSWPMVKADTKRTFTAEGPTVFRRTILVDQTPVWPLPQPALYIAGNSVQHVSFIVRGLPGKVQENWTTYLAVPEGLQVLGSTGFYGTTAENQPQFDCEAAGETIIDGETLQLYKITADKPLRNNRDAVRSTVQVMLKIADASQAKAGVSWKLHYWSQADNGTMIEPPRSFEVRALPPLNGRQPKKLVWELWSSRFNAMDNKKLRTDTLQTMQNAGFNYIMSGDSWTSEHSKKFGVGNSKMINFKAYSINLAPYLKEHSGERLINSKGKSDDGLMCTTLLVEKNWPTVVAPIMAEVLKQSNPARVTYDYEYSPLIGPHSCYCDRCLAAFRQRAHVDEDVKLTPQIIEDQYLAKWQDFMAYRAAQILAKMKDTTHQTLSVISFSTYSLFQSPRTLAVYGIDWRYVGQLNAVDMAEAGPGSPPEELAATYKALNGIPLMTGVWMTPYSADDLSPARVTTKAELLRRALDSNAGMLVYDRNPIDGRSWTAIAETSRLVAEYESTFIAHHLAEIPGQDSANVQLLKGEKESLLCVMNGTAKPVTYTFRLPIELGGGKEFYSGKDIAAGSEIQTTIAPGETAVYVLSK